MESESVAKASLFGRALRVALAFVLASYVCVPPAVAFADDPSESVSAAHEQEAQRSDSAIDEGAVGDGEAQVDSPDGEAADTVDVGNDATDAGTSGSDGRNTADSDGSDEADPADYHTGPAESTDSDGPTDIAMSWQDGGARIDQPGDYTLSADVKADKPLTIALPEGAKATLDLAGHSATVEKAPVAVDLAFNEGEIMVIDSQYDEKHPDERAAIELKVDDPEAAIATVNVVRAVGIQNADPEATFEHVRLSAMATVHEAEAYGTDVAVVRTGDDFPRTTDKETADDDAETKVVLAGCELIAESESDVSADDLAKADLTDDDRGAVAVIDAGSRGIVLDGRTSASAKRDGAEISENQAMLLSERDEAYTIAPDFEVVAFDDEDDSNDADESDDADDDDNSDDAGEGLDSHESASLTFGFPAQSADDDATEAVVAKAEAGEEIPPDAAEALKAVSGFEAVFDKVPNAEGEVSEGFAQLRLVRSGEPGESGNSGDAERQAAPTHAGENAEAVPGEGSSAGGSASAPRQSLDSSAQRPYAAYLASHAESVVYAEQIETQASGTNLNAAWKKQSKDYSSAYKITSSGTYYLNADLEASSGLVIDAPGKDVILELRGHVLTLNGTGESKEKTMLSIAAAKSVTIDGGDSGTSAIKSSGETDVRAISSVANDCVVAMSNVSVTLETDSTSQRYLATHVVRMDGGELSVSNCTLNMLMGNQTLSSPDLLYDASEVPSAVYATSATSKVELVDCAVTADGTQGFAPDGMNDLTSIGNAYALYSDAAATVVAGGSYTASSLPGNASCLFGAALEVLAGSDGSAVKLRAGGAMAAVGITSTKAGGVVLRAPIDFAAAEGYEDYAEAEAALRTQVAGGFVFGDISGSAADVSVLSLTEDDTLASANAVGAVVGTFASDLASDRQAAVVGKLVNALGSGCSITSSLLGQVLFTFDSTNPTGAVAQIGSTYYPTIASALSAFADGTTLTLLIDAGDLDVSTTGSATLDLNGHAITSFEFSTSATGSGLTVKNGAIEGLLQFTVTSAYYAAVYHHSPSPLTFSGVKVGAHGSNVTTRGIYGAKGAGSLTLDGGTSIDATVTRTASASYDVYGVDIATAGPALVIDSSSVSASTASAGSSAVAVFSRVSGTIASSDIVASGATGTVGGVAVGGTMSISDSTIDTRATGIGMTAQGYGIWAQSAAPTATSIAIDSSTVKMDTAVAVPSGYNYAALLGSTSEAGTSSATWELSGQCSFKSSSETHMGSNLGSFTLRDFSLGSDSDSPLVVSQSAKANDLGFTLSGTSDAATLVSAFEAKSGSYYEGWHLEANSVGSELVWKSDGDASGDGVVKVSGNGSTIYYPSLSQALSASTTVSGSTVQLQGDLSESGVQTISQHSLVLDLNGHALTVRGGRSATSGAVKYTGAGVLTVENGTLDIRVGASSEGVASVYQGIAVSNGGTLSLEPSATVSVTYSGSTSVSAAQQSFSLQGITVTDGEVDLVAGSRLNVTSARAANAIGALDAYGVYLAPTEYSATVDMEDGASIAVDNMTTVKATSNNYYAEGTANTALNGGPVGLREISVDPKTDVAFYQAIVNQFRISATYDDPASSSNSTRKLGIYYAQPMSLDADGEWYDGLKIWAYSDVVPTAKAGKLSSIVPAHIFISSSYEVLPNAYGIASSVDSIGTTMANVKGSVEANCTNGNAYALSANGVEERCTWLCSGAELTAQADDQVHLVPQGSIDLRDYIEFSNAYSSAVTYSGIANAQVVKFEAPVARDAVVGDTVDFTFDGAHAFAARGLDAAAVEASSFTVGPTFSLAAGSQTCSVANGAGKNKSGAVFAKGATDASLFEDAYKAYKTSVTSSGVSWKGSQGYLVTFQVGDAVVARYVKPTSIDLAEPSALAEWVDDQRYSYALAGWSTNPDERATSGYSEKGATVRTSATATYYAVYETGLSKVPVTFTNIFKADANGVGTLQGDVVLSGENAAVYGSTVGDALTAAAVSLPEPDDYIDAGTGLTCRFVGWYPYTDSLSSSPHLYGRDKVKELAVTLSVNGVNDGALTLRAVYVATRAEEHIVTFNVDGYTSVCVVRDGERPVYTRANSANASYVSPKKETSVPGKTFTFKAWADASDTTKTYQATLPRVTADATYNAVWDEQWADVELTFYVKYVDSETGELVSNGVRKVSTTYERATQDVANSIVKIGSTFGYGGQIYEMTGWSWRKSDIEPLYTAVNPLPTVSADSLMGTDYSKTYYAVYALTDHKVDVTFYDGAKELGKASKVLAASTSVNAAFSATGAKKPTDKSETNAFLGWAVSKRASSAVNGTSTMVESLTDGEQTTLSLYAVYGNLPVYRVRLFNGDRSVLWYSLRIKRGHTVLEALASKKVEVKREAVEGEFLAGWYSLLNKYYPLNTPVAGTGTYYAKFGTIGVDMPDDRSISSPSITLSNANYSQLGLTDELRGVSLSFKERGSADTPLRSKLTKYNYTPLGYYTMKVSASYKSGSVKNVDGNGFGQVLFKAQVGSKYKNVKVRAFWIGWQDGVETVKQTAVKPVDDDGNISVSIDNYSVGDEDEGGNLVLAYKLNSEHEADDIDKIEDGGDGGKGGNLNSGSAGDDSGSGGDSEDSPIDDSLSMSSPSLGSLGSLGGLSGLSSSSVNGLSSGVSSLSDGVSNASSLGAAGGANAVDEGASEVEAEEEEGEASFFSDWDSNAVVLLVLIAVALGSLVYGLWRLVVVRQRREEAEVELPDVSERYANGLTF